jgi:hypothetical protein
MSLSKFSELARNTAAPFSDDPVRVFADPFSHLDLAIHHALLGVDAFALKIQRHVFATRRLVYHADRND